MGSGARNEEESQLKGGIGMVFDERNQAISIATPCLVMLQWYYD